MTAAATVILVIGALVAVNGVLVAAEFSIVAASRTRITQRAEAGSSAARYVLSVLRDIDRQTAFLAATQVGITTTSLLLGMYGEHAVASTVAEALRPIGRLAVPAAHTIGTIATVALLTAVHVVLGEMLPKSIALRSPESTVLRVALPMKAFETMVRPLAATLNRIGYAVTAMLGVPPAVESARLMSSEELELIAEESSAHGALGSGDLTFIENIFDFTERTAARVMSPRTRVVGLPVDASLDEVLEVICEWRFSRYPVYGEDLDDIVGVLLVKDLARWYVGDGDGAFDLRSILRPPLFVPETLGLGQVLRRLRREHSSVAVVVDEFGGTAGLVTQEDVVEEIVGEIRDEFDQDEITPLEFLGDGGVRVRGDLILDELNQACDVTITHPEAETVAGLVMDELGRIARPGDVVEYQDAVFVVERVDGLAVETVLVHLRAAPSEGGAAAS